MKKSDTCKCGKRKHCRNYCKKCCKHKSCNQCRKDLCCPCFMVRLGGLQDGLSFRLRQMVCCEVQFQLNNEENVKGTIIFVGSNFVEVLVKGKPDEMAADTGCPGKEKGKKDGQSIGYTLIFPIDSISLINTLGCCHSKNPCV